MAAIIAVVAGCSSGSSSPTAPELGQIAVASASIHGEVVSVPEGLSVEGILVRVDKPPLETRTDAAGRFAFAGVEAGARTLEFQSPAISASLVLSDVRGGETRVVSVALSSSSAMEARAMDDADRGHDDDEDDHDHGDDGRHVDHVDGESDPSGGG